MSNLKLWQTVSNAGIVLLHVGLLLLLVSLISQIQIQHPTGSGTLFQGECKTVSRSWEICPFQEIELTVTVEHEGVLTVYLLETDNVFSSSDKTTGIGNSTALQLFLKENPEKIIWEDRIEDEQYTRSYFSTKFMKVVVVLYNPDSEIAHLQYEGSLCFFGSTDQTRNVAVCATPLGVLLSIPWLVSKLKLRKNKLE